MLINYSVLKCNSYIHFPYCYNIGLRNNCIWRRKNRLTPALFVSRLVKWGPWVYGGTVDTRTVTATNFYKLVLLSKWSNKHVFYQKQVEKYQKWLKTVFIRAVFTANGNFRFIVCEVFCFMHKYNKMHKYIARWVYYVMFL